VILGGVAMTVGCGGILGDTLVLLQTFFGVFRCKKNF